MIAKLILNIALGLIFTEVKFF